MLITEMEVVGLLQFSVRRTAAKLKVTDVEWKSSEELLDEIEKKDPVTCNLLRSFMNAYIEWFRFHKRIESQGKQGNLDYDEKQELAKHIHKRDTTRKAILEQLAQVE